MNSAKAPLTIYFCYSFILFDYLIVVKLKLRFIHRMFIFNCFESFRKTL